MKVVVFGYHNIGAACLRVVVAQGHEVAAVVTHEDDPGENVWFESVAGLASQHGLRVLTPEDPNAPEFVAEMLRLAPDIILSFYYRYMLKQPLLDLAPLGALNLHGSHLPKYRGRCPINWVLLKGETETGVTLHYMVERPDAGDIVAQRRIPISIRDTALSLHEKMTHAAEDLLAQALPLLASGTAPCAAQDDAEATYYGGRRPEDGRFDWSDDAQSIYNLVRAVTHPYPGAFTALGQDRLHVWWCAPQCGPPAVRSEAPGTVEDIGPAGLVIATGEGSLLLISVQVGAGPVMAGRGLARTCSLVVGDTISLQ